MPNLPYHEDNQERKNTAINDIVSRTQRYLDGEITEKELADEIFIICCKLGIIWDSQRSLK